MLIIKKLLVFSTAFVFLQSCVKKEVDLQNIHNESLNPSFAIPIGQSTFNLGRLENHFADDHFVYNPTTGILEYVYPKELFRLGLADLLKLPTLAANASFGMPLATQTAFTTGGAGTSVNFSGQTTTVFPMVNGELMDSIIIKQGTLDIALTSDYMHNGSVDVIIPSLTLNGAAFNQTIVFNYSGPVPVIVNTNGIDISGYTLDMTDGGITDNTARFAFNAIVTNSGNPLSGTETLALGMNFTIDTIQQANGYFGSFVNILSQDTVFVDFFNKMNGSMHVEDPRIELLIYNTAGIDVHTDFTGIFAPDNSVTVNLGGPGLTSIPTVVGAATIADTGITTHVVDNNNTNPTLSAVVDEGPGEIIYSTTSTTNPAGIVQNFLTYKSEVWCDSRLVLPLYGWGDNFEFEDTTNTDIDGALDMDSTDIDNLEKLTLRIIVDNGLPVETRVQVYFADTNDGIIDSLFDNVNAGADIIRKANVNFSLPLMDPNYGKVTSAVRKITDIVIDKTRFNNLANRGAEKLIYKAYALTNEAPTGKNVKFYPEYELTIKISAKVDFDITINPNSTSN